MNSNRRKFLRDLSVGTGALAAGLATISNQALAATDEQMERSALIEKAGRRFNMCGYAAPKLTVVRVGMVGIGSRGSSAVQRLVNIDGLEIVALCDKRPEQIARNQKTLEKAGRPKAKEYSGEDGWKAMCESNDIDLVYNATRGICMPRSPCWP